jgi:hypothetical protein
MSTSARHHPTRSPPTSTIQNSPVGLRLRKTGRTLRQECAPRETWRRSPRIFDDRFNFLSRLDGQHKGAGPITPIEHIHAHDSRKPTNARLERGIRPTVGTWPRWAALPGSATSRNVRMRCRLCSRYRSDEGPRYALTEQIPYTGGHLELSFAWFLEQSPSTWAVLTTRGITKRVSR